MYAEPGVMFPFLQNFSPDVYHFEDFCRSYQPPNAYLDNLVQTSSISEYNLGGEGDLFKAPEPIIEEIVTGLDPITVSMSMSCCVDDVISLQGLNIADIESIQNEQMLNDIFCGYKNEILANGSIEGLSSEILPDLEIPVLGTDETVATQEILLPQEPLQRSVSSGCLSSFERLHGASISSNFVDFPGMDFEAIYGMRRAFSEGDMKTVGKSNLSLIRTPLVHPQLISVSVSEDRMQKLSRYWNKKTKRNFGRKIKYACRKALADSQPRIRGRFAKTEDSETCKNQ